MMERTFQYIRDTFGEGFLTCVGKHQVTVRGEKVITREGTITNLVNFVAPECMCGGRGVFSSKDLLLDGPMTDDSRHVQWKLSTCPCTPNSPDIPEEPELTDCNVKHILWLAIALCFGMTNNMNFKTFLEKIYVEGDLWKETCRHVYYPTHHCDHEAVEALARANSNSGKRGKSFFSMHRDRNLRFVSSFTGFANWWINNKRDRHASELLESFRKDDAEPKALMKLVKKFGVGSV